MLKRLTLKNFQKHKSLSLDLDPHCTVLVGCSDSGKSAVIRALYWLCFNKPSGNEIIKHGAEQTTVKAVVDKSCLVRIKGKDTNAYFLDGKDFRALGVGGVPKEVEDFLNLSPEVNFQLQLDGPYWFLKSPQQVARELNRMVNLELIDHSLEYAAQEVRRAKSRAEASEERLMASQAREKALSWVGGADKSLREIEGLEKRARELEREEEKLEEWLTQIEGLEKLADFTFPEREVEEIEALIAEEIRLDTEATKLQVTINLIRKKEEELCRARRSLGRAETRMRELSLKGCPACGRPL